MHMGDPSAVDTASVFNNFLEFTPIKLAFNESAWAPDLHTPGEQLYARGQSQEHRIGPLLLCECPLSVWCWGMSRPAPCSSSGCLLRHRPAALRILPSVMNNLQVEVVRTHFHF